MAAQHILQQLHMHPLLQRASVAGLLGPGRAANVFVMHPVICGAPVRMVSCWGMYDGVGTGQRLQDECDAMDLAAVRRLEARLSNGSTVPQDTLKLQGPAKGPGAQNGDSAWEEGSIAGVLWERAPEEYTDEDLWEEVGNEIPAMWDTAPDPLPDDITIVSPPPGAQVVQAPSEFVVISLPDGSAVASPNQIQIPNPGEYVTEGPGGKVILESLPPIVIKVNKDVAEGGAEEAAEGSTGEAGEREGVGHGAARDANGRWIIDESNRGWGDHAWQDMFKEWSISSQMEQDYYEEDMKEEMEQMEMLAEPPAAAAGTDWAAGRDSSRVGNVQLGVVDDGTAELANVAREGSGAGSAAVAKDVKQPDPVATPLPSALPVASSVASRSVPSGPPQQGLQAAGPRSRPWTVGTLEGDPDNPELDSRALVALPYPTDCAAPPSSGTHVKVTFTDADVEAGRTAGYWTQRLQQLGALDEEGRNKVISNRRSSSIVTRVIINSHLATAPKPELVFQLHRDVGPLMDKVNLSTALQRLARLATMEEQGIEHDWSAYVKSHPQYPAMLADMTRRLAFLQPRQVADVCWAIAKLEDVENIGVLQVCPNVEHVVLHDWNTNMLQQVADDLVAGKLKLSIFTDVELAKLIWAYGCAGLKHNELLQSVCMVLIRRGLHDVDTQAISNILWAHAKLGYKDEALLRAAAIDLSARVKDYSNLSISNMLWACGTLGCGAVDAIQAVLPLLPGRLRGFGTQELSSMLLGLAKMDVVDQAFIEALLQELVYCHGQAVMAEVLVPAKLATMSNMSFAHMCWALGMMRYRNDEWMYRVYRFLDRRAGELDAIQLNMLISSLARLDISPAVSLLQPLLERVDQLLEEDHMDPVSARTLVWSIALLCGTNHPLLRKLVLYLVAHGLEGDDNLDTDSQLFHVLLLSRAEVSNVPMGALQPSLLSLVPPDMVQRAYKRWQQVARNDVQTSKIQMEVSQVLSAMGIPHTQEYMTEAGLFSVDIAIVGGSKKVAIEVGKSGSNSTAAKGSVDGPCHFTCNTLQPTGAAQLRYRLLQTLGWYVISVPWYDWYRLSSNKNGRMQYLAHKLANLEEYTGPPAPPSPQVCQAVLKAKVHNTLTQTLNINLMGVPLLQDAATILGLQSKQPLAAVQGTPTERAASHKPGKTAAASTSRRRSASAPASSPPTPSQSAASQRLLSRASGRAPAGPTTDPVKHNPLASTSIAARRKRGANPTTNGAADSLEGPAARRTRPISPAPQSGRPSSSPAP